MLVEGLPFSIGRHALAGDPPVQHDAELLLRFTHPYEMAPRHFVLEERDGGLVIGDLNMVLGTFVNGIRLASFEQADSKPLRAYPSDSPPDVLQEDGKPAPCG